MASALAGESGSAVRAADELRFLLRRDELGGPRAIYVPATTRTRRPILLLAPIVSGFERELFIVKAVGHLMLRHRSLREYAYDVDGAMYESPLEALEVEVFADAFVSALPTHIATARDRFAVVASGRSR